MGAGNRFSRYQSAIAAGARLAAPQSARISQFASASRIKPPCDRPRSEGASKFFFRESFKNPCSPLQKRDTTRLYANPAARAIRITTERAESPVFGLRAPAANSDASFRDWPRSHIGRAPKEPISLPPNDRSQHSYSPLEPAVALARFVSVQHPLENEMQI